MKVRSSVSADFSKGIIWVNSSDFHSTVEAVKICEVLTEELGYTDSSILEESGKGNGVSLSVCGSVTIKQMREDYMHAKHQQIVLETTQKHLELAKAYQSQLNII
ncbi:hypothetical protein ABMY12_20890 [Vibrio vulnificus]|uniref:hypothetical protein n=1 Tax=Vibrio vulnificus TaxID=672 RepID=UPI00405916E7